MEGRSFSSIWFQASSANREQQICPYWEFYSQINKPLTCSIVDHINTSVLWRPHGHSPATAAPCCRTPCLWPARHHIPCPHGSAKLPANRVDPTPHTLQQPHNFPEQHTIPRVLWPLFHEVHYRHPSKDLLLRTSYHQACSDQAKL